MKLGIKVGLKNDSFEDLDKTQAPACEVWYNASKAHDYTDFLEKLSRRGIDVGLHYWGALPDGTMTNIAYPDASLNQASMGLMMQTLETAAYYHCVYVNIHPGSYTTIKVDFETYDYPYVSAPCDLHKAQENFLTHAENLQARAKELGVVLTVETVARLSPKTHWYVPSGRLNTINLYDMPLATVLAAKNAGIPVANDFVHSATQSQSTNRTDIWNNLKQTTLDLFDATRLIHVGFYVPPYNGADNHDMLDNPLFETDRAIPNKNEMRELLQLFKQRNDVWAITEPRQDHVKNYFLAKKLQEN